MPASEQTVKVGQQRVIFVDGIGFLTAKIVAIHTTYLEVQAEEDDITSIYEIDWPCLGILTNGECMVAVQEKLCQELGSMLPKTPTT